jgi:hypothetical protein
VIDGFLEEHGHRRVDQMTREHVDIIVGKMASKPGAGIILLKRIRALVRYAMALEGDTIAILENEETPPPITN